MLSHERDTESRLLLKFIKNNESQYNRLLGQFNNMYTTPLRSSKFKAVFYSLISLARTGFGRRDTQVNRKKEKSWISQHSSSLFFSSGKIKYTHARPGIPDNSRRDSLDSVPASERTTRPTQWERKGGSVLLHHTHSRLFPAKWEESSDVIACS